MLLLHVQVQCCTTGQLVNQVKTEGCLVSLLSMPKSLCAPLVAVRMPLLVHLRLHLLEVSVLTGCLMFPAVNRLASTAPA